MDKIEPDKNILVTGGTGFVGSYLLRYLVERGYRNIRAIKRPSSPMALVSSVENRIEWMECDLLNLPALEEAFRGIDCAFHSAAIVSYNPRDSKEMHLINVEGTTNVVNTSLYEGIEKLVHVSSIAAIGRSKKSKTISEKTKWERSNVNSAYAVSKYLAEKEVWRGIAEGLPAAIANPGIILGSGFWEGGTQKIFRLIQRGFPFYPAGSSSFVDVRDVARFLIQLMESEFTEERFIVSAENWSFKRLFTTIAYFLDQAPPNIKVTPIISKIAWRLEWIRSRIFGGDPIITKETAKQSAFDFSYQNEKSGRYLDFEYTSITETIEATCKQLLEATEDDFTPKQLALN